MKKNILLIIPSNSHNNFDSKILEIAKYIAENELFEIFIIINSDEKFAKLYNYIHTIFKTQVEVFRMQTIEDFKIDNLNNNIQIYYLFNCICHLADDDGFKIGLVDFIVNIKKINSKYMFIYGDDKTFDFIQNYFCNDYELIKLDYFYFNVKYNQYGDNDLNI